MYSYMIFLLHVSFEFFIPSKYFINKSITVWLCNVLFIFVFFFILIFLFSLCSTTLSIQFSFHRKFLLSVFIMSILLLLCTCNNYSFTSNNSNIFILLLIFPRYCFRFNVANVVFGLIKPKPSNFLSIYIIFLR